MVRIFCIISSILIFSCSVPQKVQRFCEVAKRNNIYISDTLNFKIGTFYKTLKMLDTTLDENFLHQQNELFKRYIFGYEFLNNGKYKYYMGRKDDYLSGCYTIENGRIILYRKYYSPQAGNFYYKEEFIIKDTLLIQVERGKNIMIYSR